MRSEMEKMPMTKTSDRKRRTHYSPGGETNFKLKRQQNFNDTLDTQEKRSFRLDEIHPGRRSSPASNHRKADQRFTQSNQHSQLSASSQSDSQTDETENKETEEEEEEVQAKEVYICNCCGVSKELNPSIEFMSTFKALFFLFNFLVFIFGLANFGLGLWFRIDPKVYEIHKYIETQNFTIAGWILLFCGFTACLIALIGFISAVNQAAGLLVFYFTMMIPLTLAFVGALVLLTVYGFGATLEKFLIKEIYEQIRRRSVSSDSSLYGAEDAAQFMDFVQVKMRCCGASDFNDYGKLGMIVPTTCYTIDKNYVSAPGCGHAIRLLLDLRGGLAAGFTSGSIVAQLLTTILSALMFCSIYHYRASSRPITPTTNEQLEPALPLTTPNVVPDSPVNHQHLYAHQRPRSRTPILI